MRIIKFIQGDKYAGYVLTLMVLVYFSNQFNRFIFSSSKIPFIDYKSYEYGLIVGPIFTVMYTLAGILMGLAGEVRRVKVLYTSVLVWSLFIACISVTTNFWQVGILTAGLGIGEAGCTPFASSLLSDIFPEELQGTAMGIYNLSIYLAYGMALALGSMCEELLGWGGIYLMAGCYGGVVGILVALTVKDPMDAQNHPSLFHASRRTYSTILGRQMSEEGRERLRLREQSLSLQDNSPNLGQRAPYATNRTKSSLKRVWRWWSRTPSLVILCLAAGLRKGAGVIWADYTAIFFAGMFTTSALEGPCQWSYSDEFGEPASGDVCPGNYPYCLADSRVCASLNGTPWHDRGMSRDDFEFFIAWVPLVAGSIGVLTGGWISDYYTKTYGPIARLYVILALTILAAPFAAGVLILGDPWCYMALVGCLLIGEGWTGVCLALILDCSPPSIRATSVAIFLFITSNIGGNMALLCPYFQHLFKENHIFSFEIYPEYGSDQSGTIQTEVEQESSSALQSSLLILFPGMYILSALIFSVTFGYLRKDFESNIEDVSVLTRSNTYSKGEIIFPDDTNEDSLPFLESGSSPSEFNINDNPKAK